MIIKIDIKFFKMLNATIAAKRSLIYREEKYDY